MRVITLYVGTLIAFGTIAVFVPGPIGARARVVFRILARSRERGQLPG